MGAAFSHWKQTSWPVFVQIWPPAPKFHVDQIPDLSGQTVIVTGGNSGSGYETVKVLLQHNAKVYLAARSRTNADAAIVSLREELGKEPMFLELDLASLSSVKNAADEFLSKESELHVLFCNAGVMWTPIDQLSEDGYDLQWGTNVVGHYYFSKLLMPALFAGAQTSPDHHARVITTSSSGAYLQTLEYDTFRDGPARRKLGTTQLYYQSKHGNAIVALELGDPGNFKTNLTRHASTFFKIVLEVLLLYPAPFGALTQLFAGTMPEALNYNGEVRLLSPYYAVVLVLILTVYNDEIGSKLWDWLEAEVKAFEASAAA
ncbi:hypothetical protein GSI_02741 [Ganoderma sinense ZZ0214-1]|uniref:Uncharacterized protein n=1 Tax=Ganoderma sinense ZZ0214-1 TaxID=1077348 RepID=A0A2G8SMF5_9APHY|nr:hypothetical protein GSI_02741 [Ganoderma sinense ZZ0214-1]